MHNLGHPWDYTKMPIPLQNQHDRKYLSDFHLILKTLNRSSAKLNPGGKRALSQPAAQENIAWAGASNYQPLWAALGQRGEGSHTHPAALAQQPGTAAHWSLLLGGSWQRWSRLQAQLQPF